MRMPCVGRLERSKRLQVEADDLPTVDLENMDETELEWQSRIADAGLGAAEELGWVIAILTGALAQIKSDSWLLAAALAGFAYWLATARYRRRAAAAQDAHYRAARLGKYASSSD